MQAATIGMFEEVDRQLDALARVATAPVEPTEPPRTIAAPRPDVTFLPPPPATGPGPRVAVVIAATVAALLGLGVIAAFNIAHLIGERTLTGKAAADAVVTRILTAESHGATDPKNKRSSAVGPAQFLDDTWLELIRAYRPDLTKGRSRGQLLALRNESHLAREIAMRFAERNAALLRRRGLPVTPGTLYLAHFAGAAGAVALLKAPPHADAAGVMAMADASGKTSRDKIVKANPFLDDFTVTDIRRWAERKMNGPALVLTELLSASTKK